MIRHCQSPRKINNVDLSKLLFFAAIALFAGSLAYRIHSAGKLAVKNETLKTYTEKKSSLEKEIALLEYENSKYSSLKYLESAALSMGLVRAVDPLLAVEFAGGASIASAR